MSLKSEEKNLTAMMIIEVLGRPEEHLTTVLEDLSKQVEAEPGVKSFNKKLNKPTLIKDQKDLFTGFVEIEMEIENPAVLAALMFKYMPSHVEVIEPEHFVFKNVEFNELLNELTRRLHRYEELVKVLQFEIEKNKKVQAKKPEEKK
ncbi:MAG: hypothetical protein KKB62_03765 [Nanoarchaeota archaeon]|nr:hypothetical protein [Nanoarchaeota archaeon]